MKGTILRAIATNRPDRHCGFSWDELNLHRISGPRMSTSSGLGLLDMDLVDRVRLRSTLQAMREQSMLLSRMTTVMLFAVFVAPAQAADSYEAGGQGSPLRVANEHFMRGLSPAQLTAIRGVGRNVLGAKESGAEDSADVEQLRRVRTTVDALIAVDLDPQYRAPLTVQSQETNEQRKTREKVDYSRESVRADARALAAQLRQRGELKASHARSLSGTDTLSAGLPIGEQRARLFKRWAQKLDLALADDGEDHPRRLNELRNQFRSTNSGVNEMPLAHGTPTLQAMPAGYVPPKAKSDHDGAATD